MTALQLKTELRIAKDRYNRGEIPLADLYKAADAYADALRQYRKQTGKKFRIPSRAYLIRLV